METKKQIRYLIAQRRSGATITEIKNASGIICEKVITSSEFIDSKHIYVYIDFNNEVETRTIIETAWQMGKQVAVPKVEERNMVFYEITSFDQLKPGCLGILEPTNCQKVTYNEALLIVPGVAFDKKRHRIGYGGGFYDRYLAQSPNHFTLAIAFDFQLIEEAPFTEHDIIPQRLITESGTF